MISLKKGEKINLKKESDGEKLEKIQVGLGWDTRTDLDSMAFLFDESGKLRETVYFCNKTVAGVTHHGDNLTGEGEGDDELITVTLKNLPDWVNRISFAANIYAAKVKLWGVKDFSKVKNAYIRIVNKSNKKVLCRYDLNENGKGFNGFHFADLVKENDEWHVKAVGEGVNGSVDKIGEKIEKRLQSM